MYYMIRVVFTGYGGINDIRIYYTLLRVKVFVICIILGDELHYQGYPIS